MKVLVTGGAGYVGSTLVGMLLKKGYEVVVIDKLMYGKESLSSYINTTNFTLHEGDICNEEDLKKVVTKDLNAIIHLAAIVGDPACKNDPERAKKTNWEGSKMLIDYADKMGVKRFVFSSTCSNYGKMDSTSK